MAAAGSGRRRGGPVRDPGRHRGDDSSEPSERSFEPFERSFEALGRLAYAEARVSASASDLDSGEVLLAIDETVSLPGGEIGVLLLLVDVAARIEDDSLPALELLERGDGAVEGRRAAGGLWSSLVAPVLTVVDAAALVGAVRDPGATNALIRRVGLESVRARGEALGLSRTALLDLIRAERGPDDAPQLSVASAVELEHLVRDLVHGDRVGIEVGNRVLGWLSGGVDLSVVASAFGLDPVAHRAADHGLQLVNVTGSARGVRSEAGALRGASRGVSYAATVAFDDTDLVTRLRVLEALRTVGFDLLEYVG
ncbi:serine hydrolase [Frondihabitans cladoniiphilus]|uniref:Beta-lactamase class A catalytic domain-containing protein n=1 Tax=Frondihabitans cladoniiphilus TaxID=715785 RepID=A0ABP8W009_9MICO